MGNSRRLEFEDILRYLRALDPLSDSSKEKEDSDDSLELLYTGMDADELDEVSSCDNLSDSDVSNESGKA